MAEQVCWLIERADPSNPGNVLAGNFLGIEGHWDGMSGSGVFRWLPHAHDALRFSRKKDAAMFAGAIVAIQGRLVHDSTLPGLRSGDPKPILVEHVWTDS